jgi:hypothetical protein
MKKEKLPQWRELGGTELSPESWGDPLRGLAPGLAKVLGRGLFPLKASRVAFP